MIILLVEFELCLSVWTFVLVSVGEFYVVCFRSLNLLWDCVFLFAVSFQLGFFCAIMLRLHVHHHQNMNLMSSGRSGNPLESLLRKCQHTLGTGRSEAIPLVSSLGCFLPSAPRPRTQNTPNTHKTQVSCPIL